MYTVLEIMFERKKIQLFKMFKCLFCYNNVKLKTSTTDFETVMSIELYINVLYILVYVLITI